MQLWRHRKSGDLYVIRLGGDNEPVVVDATGPLHHSEVDTALRGDFDSDPELADWINENGDDFDWVR